MIECQHCHRTGARPTDYAGWKRILGRLLCATCSKRFPSWMQVAR